MPLAVFHAANVAFTIASGARRRPRIRNEVDLGREWAS
jgi:hypothetical protein